MNEELQELNASMPTLTFGETMPTAAPAAETAEEQAKAEAAPLQINLDDTMLSVEQFTSSIDLKNTQGIMEYGAGVQKKMADFSQKTLDQVRTKDLGEIGSLLTNVVAEVKGFDDSTESKGLFGLFKKGRNKVESMKASYDKTEANITKICDSLENHQVTLLKDVATLDQMYALNMASFKEITMYILAGLCRRKRLCRWKGLCR